MKSRFKNSIVFKIFAVTAALLLASTLLIYAIIYFVLPNYYKNYKKDFVNQSLDILVKQINDKDLIALGKSVITYAQKNNVNLYITDVNNNVNSKLDGINCTLIYSGMKNVYMVTYSKMTDSNGMKMDGYFSVMDSDTNNRYYYTAKRVFKIKGDSTTYYLHGVITLQPVSEISLMMIKLLPLVLAAIMIISLSSALIYARLVSKPLLSLNKTAREMAAMKLDIACGVGGKDEIGELSKSLNTLAINLKTTIGRLEESNRQLELDIEREHESERQRRDFMASVSHELKTPLTIIKGQLEGMIWNIGVYKDRDMYLRRSYAIAEGMEILVREVLDISRMEASSFKLDMQDISLSQAVITGVEGYNELAMQKGISIDSQIAEGIRINADRRLIIKAVSNILNNAVSHSPDGASVKVRLMKKGGSAAFSVENSGAHIDDSESARIFEAFYTADKSRGKKSGGSGLGLYIVKTILDMHAVPYKLENTESGVSFCADFKLSEGC